MARCVRPRLFRIRYGVADAQHNTFLRRIFTTHQVISTPEKMSQEYEQRISEGGSDFGGGVGGEFHSQSSLRHSGAKKRQLFSEGGDDDYQEDEQLLASSVVKKMRFSIPDN